VVLPLDRSVDPDFVSIWIVPAEEGLLEVLAEVPHFGLCVIQTLGEEVDRLVRGDRELLDGGDGGVPRLDLRPVMIERCWS
jgi:hypothetical protein